MMIKIKNLIKMKIKMAKVLMVKELILEIKMKILDFLVDGLEEIKMEEMRHRKKMKTIMNFFLGEMIMHACTFYAYILRNIPKAHIRKPRSPDPFFRRIKNGILH